MMDMSEFGEAAPFLRKSEKELMMAQTVAFDGESQYPLCCRWPVKRDKGYIQVQLRECRAKQDAKPLLSLLCCCSCSG